MAAPNIDKKEVLEIFKFLNMGGIAGVVVIGAVVGVMYGSGCGPIRNSNNYGEERLWGTPVLEAHPEAAAAVGHDDHADEAHGAEAHGDEAHGTEAAH